MSRFKSATQADFEAGEAVNVRATLDGLAVLSGKNKADNPDFDDADPANPEGTKGHTLGSAPAYAGWGVLARKRAALNNGVRTPVRGTTLQKQNASPLPWERAAYRQEGPLVAGGEPAANPLPLYRPPRPSVRLIPHASVGYANRFFGIALAGVVGQLGRGDARLLTAPSPRVYANPAAGQSIRAYLGEAAEGWIGVAVLMTPPCDTQAQAQTAPLFIQRVRDVREAVPEYHDLTGSFRRDDLAPSSATNETYLAAEGEYPAPRRRFRGAPGMLRPLAARFSYQIKRRDHPGWSAVQRFTDLVTVAAERPKEALAFRLPGAVPRATHQWRLVMETADGSLVAFGPLSPGAEQLVYTADVAKYPQGSRPVSVESPDTDETGVEGPTSPPDEPSVFGSAKLPPGDYEVRVYGTLNDPESGETREGPPSDFVVVTLPEEAPGAGVSSHTFQVQTPDANIVFNPRYVEEDPDGTDSGWERPVIAGVTYAALGRGNFGITDRSNSAANAYVRLARETRPVDPTNPYTLVVPLTLLDRTGGRVNAAVYFYNAQDQQIGVSTLQGATALGKTRVMKSVGPAGSGADISWPAGTVGLRPAIQLVGSSDGARNLSLKKGPIGIYPGLFAPQLTLAEEEAGDPRNPGGYCRVLPQADSDTLLPPALVGRGVRVMEYYGPLGTPPSPRYGTTGFRMAVAPGVRYAESVYLWWQGVTNASHVLTMGVKNALGETLLTLPPFQAGMLGSSPWLRKQLDFTAPEGAAYLEVVSGNFSDGLVRCAAVQHEESSTGVPTAYDNTNPLSGALSAILDTQIDGADANMPVFAENPVVRWLRAGSVHTNTENTAVQTRFSGGATPGEADAAPLASLATASGLGTPRYLKVRDDLSTTDATESPEVDELYLDAERRDPVLTREDGSEFPGGVKVGNLPPPARDPGTVEDEMASGKVRTREVRPEKRWLRGIELVCYRKSAQTEVSSYAKRAKRAGVEGDGARYVVEIPGEISWDFDRDGWHPMIQPNGAWDPDGWYVFRASVDAEIVSEAVL